jgi:hypothetical protein
LVEQHPGEFSMMSVEPATERFDQIGVFESHPAARQTREPTTG